MRKIDKAKTRYEKVQKGINFDKLVLEKLEWKAKMAGTSVSRLVNGICRQLILSDAVYYESLCKHYAMKLAEAQYMRRRAEESKGLKSPNSWV